MPAHTDPIERIKRRLVVDDNGCWNWPGATTRGYGCISVLGKVLYTHRLMSEAMCGPIPDGLCVLHHCDNPRCCNPDHLFLGTRADNTQDMIAKGRNVPPPRLVGEHHHAARFTELEVARIRSRHRNGQSARSLAAELGVAKSSIQRIVNHKTWRHVA